MTDSTLNSTTVNIYGQSYTVKGKVDSDFIKKVADYVDDKMHEVGANVSSSASMHRIAVLTALNIAGDLFQLTEDKDSLLQHVKNKSEQLISTIEETINN